MGMLPTDRRAWRAEPHSTPETWGTRCNGCPELACIESDRSRLHPWRYYCELLKKQVDVYGITKAECPLHREIKRGRRGA